MRATDRKWLRRYEPCSSSRTGVFNEINEGYTSSRNQYTTAHKLKTPWPQALVEVSCKKRVGAYPNTQIQTENKKCGQESCVWYQTRVQTNYTKYGAHHRSTLKIELYLDRFQTSWCWFEGITTRQWMFLTMCYILWFDYCSIKLLEWNACHLLTANVADSPQKFEYSNLENCLGLNTPDAVRQHHNSSINLIWDENEDLKMWPIIR